MANEVKTVFGTAQTVIDLSTDIANGNFSGAPSATFDNTTDGVTPYALRAKVMAEFPDWGAAPTASSVVSLYGVLKDTDGTDDDTDAPSGTSAGGARFFGNFILSATDALQRRTIFIDIEGMEKIDFYLLNSSGQNMNNDGGTNCVVKVTPFTYKPV
jgi:hypothetical protein